MIVNLEIPTEENLKILAPEKDFQSVFTPMKYIQQGMLQITKHRRPSQVSSCPPFCPRRSEYANLIIISFDDFITELIQNFVYASF